MDKLAYIKEFLKIRLELLSIIQSIDNESAELTKLKNSWSIKDLIAHINWYDNECVLLIKTKNLEGSKLWGLSPDERNRKIRKLNSSKLWDELISEFKNNTPRIKSGIENLSVEEWQNPRSFKQMPLELKPFEIIDSNLNDHYNDHLKQLKEV